MCSAVMISPVNQDCKLNAFDSGRITSKEGEGHSGIVLLQAAESSGRIDTVVSLMYISV